MGNKQKGGFIDPMVQFRITTEMKSATAQPGQQPDYDASINQLVRACVDGPEGDNGEEWQKQWEPIYKTVIDEYPELNEVFANNHEELP